MKPKFVAFNVVLLAACAPPSTSVDEAIVRPQSRPDALAPPPAEDARTVEEFDTTTDAQRAAAIAPPVGGRLLGKTVASLGDVGRPGFWAETPLVDTPRAGRLVDPETGIGVAVQLFPIAGGGTRVSLAALRALGVALTGLPVLEIHAD